MRLTDRVCDKLAGLRFRVAEIAETAMNQAPAATPRDLPAAWPKLRGGESRSALMRFAWAMLITTVAVWWLRRAHRAPQPMQLRTME